MSEAMAEIVTRLDNLPQQERAEMVLALLRSLENEPLTLADAWYADLEREVARLQKQRLIGPAVEDPLGRSWTIAELRRLPPEQRDAILEAAAERAGEDYRNGLP